nr:nucleotidyltransferase family protein [Paenibacillus bovis]
MVNWKNILIKKNNSILQTMRIIESSSLQFAVVVDDEMCLLGTVTDGDIRRGLIKGLQLNTPIQEVMNKKPIFLYSGKRQSYYKSYMERTALRQLPIVDRKKRVEVVLFSDRLQIQTLQKENPVILMAGGLGTRLRPLTNNIPKPMLKVGDKPILEIIIENCKNFGFVNFIIPVNYRKEIIQDYFQEGQHHGVNITYIEETKRLGTAGALSLLTEKPKAPFFVMNGDLLTKINFEQLLDFHNETNSLATMCVRDYEYQIPYGVIKTDNYRLLSIEEKPVHKSFVNAGIYVLNPEIISHIPYNEYLDMPELFRKLISDEKTVTAFPLREYWLDIGQLRDYEKANVEFNEYFIEDENK